MKTLITRILLSLSAILISSFASAIELSSGDQELNSTQESMVNIDATDTIVFDLSQADTLINQVEFPLYFISDDTINAVDFSLRYNQLNFEFDSVINLTPNLQVMTYFNVSDSTLRFTSNSLQRIPNDTILINIRFNVFSGTLCVSDLSDILVYLNGDLCSSKVVDCISNSIPEFDRSNQFASVYPTLASQSLNVHANENLQVVITNLIGKTFMPEFVVMKDQIKTIDVSNLTSGIYLIRLQFNDTIVSKKIVIAN